MGAGDYHEDCPLQAQALEHLAHTGGTVWSGSGGVALLEGILDVNL